jgi:hypothetical protein
MKRLRKRQIVVTLENKNARRLKRARDDGTYEKITP